MGYGGGMNELAYPSDLTTAQWALIEPLLPAAKTRGRRRKVDLRSLRTPFFMYSRVASPGACCRKISLLGRPCTIAFAFGDSPDCGTESTINFGMKCESNDAGMLARVQPLWIVRVVTACRVPSCLVLWISSVATAPGSMTVTRTP
jgi:hypothetical protein